MACDTTPSMTGSPGYDLKEADVLVNAASRYFEELERFSEGRSVGAVQQTLLAGAIGILETVISMGIEDAKPEMRRVYASLVIEHLTDALNRELEPHGIRIDTRIVSHK